MFIQTEGTPNPATVKFLPGCMVMEKGTANFSKVEDAGRSPLALHLFEIEGVGGVFFGSDFITVTKADDKSWDALKPLILSAVMEHFTACKPVMEEGSEVDESGEASRIMQYKEMIKEF